MRGWVCRISSSCLPHPNIASDLMLLPSSLLHNVDWLFEAFVPGDLRTRMNFAVVLTCKKRCRICKIDGKDMGAAILLIIASIILEMSVVEMSITTDLYQPID